MKKISRVKSIQQPSELLRQQSNGAWASQVSGQDPTWGEEDDDGNGWDEEEEGGWDEEEVRGWDEPGLSNQFSTGSALVRTKTQGKGYRIVELQAFGLDVINKIEELTDLFGLDRDNLIIIARHYKWSQTKMQNWFGEMETKQFALGVEFDERIVSAHPEINTSLPENHGGYCMINNEELNEENSFALKCRHTFCYGCWQDYLKERVHSGYLGNDSTCMQ